MATIDIELTNIDINQCDATEEESVGALDVFRGTHNCQPTTKVQRHPRVVNVVVASGSSTNSRQYITISIISVCF